MICSSLNLDGRIVRLPFGRRTLPKTGGGLRAQVTGQVVALMRYARKATGPGSAWFSRQSLQLRPYL